MIVGFGRLESIRKCHPDRFHQKDCHYADDEKGGGPVQ
jgi:hypothetical protein